MGAPAGKGTQDALIKGVEDSHKANGYTKAPKVPLPSVHVTDVESKPDPNHIDTNPDVIESPADRSAEPLSEIEPESGKDPADSGTTTSPNALSQLLNDVKRENGGDDKDS